MTNRKSYLGICCAAALLATPAAAADNRAAMGEDDEWITVTGTVLSVAGEDFALGYNGGTIEVEMDDHELDADRWLRKGDRVTVSGEIDDDFYDRRSIEANSVYVPRLNEYFYAGDAEERLRGHHARSVATYGELEAASDDEFVSFTGRVVEVEGNELGVEVGGRVVRVDGGDLDRASIDKDVDVGDHVSVSGEIDDADLFGDREVDASAITVMTRSAG